jgi:hypothetical protein
MHPSPKTYIVPVTDLAAAQAAYTALLGSPTTAEPWYVGWAADGQNLGLDPSGRHTVPTPYWHVDDVASTRADLLAAGATGVQDVQDVGGGRLTTVLLVDGHPVGLVQEA